MEVSDKRIREIVGHYNLDPEAQFVLTAKEVAQAFANRVIGLSVLGELNVWFNKHGDGRYMHPSFYQRLDEIGAVARGATVRKEMFYADLRHGNNDGYAALGEANTANWIHPKSYSSTLCAALTTPRHELPVGNVYTGDGITNSRWPGLGRTNPAYYYHATTRPVPIKNLYSPAEELTGENVVVTSGKRPFPFFWKPTKIKGKFQQSHNLAANIGKPPPIRRTNEKFDMVQMYHTLDQTFTHLTSLGLPIAQWIAQRHLGHFHPIRARTSGTPLPNAFCHPDAESQNVEQHITFGSMGMGPLRMFSMADPGTATHELAHVFIDHLSSGEKSMYWGEGLAMNEGAADAFENLIHGDPNNYEDGGFHKGKPEKPLRTAKNDFRISMPGSQGMRHTSQIYSGFFWDLMESLKNNYSETQKDAQQLAQDEILKLLLTTFKFLPAPSAQQTAVEHRIDFVLAVENATRWLAHNTLKGAQPSFSPQAADIVESFLVTIRRRAIYRFGLDKTTMTKAETQRAERLQRAKILLFQADDCSNEIRKSDGHRALYVAQQLGPPNNTYKIVVTQSDYPIPGLPRRITVVANIDTKSKNKNKTRSERVQTFLFLDGQLLDVQS